MNLKLSAFSMLAAALLNADPGSAYKSFGAEPPDAIYPSESQAYRILHAGESEVVYLRDRDSRSVHEGQLELCRAGHYSGGSLEGLDLFLIPDIDPKPGTDEPHYAWKQCWTAGVYSPP